jgi:AraC-like DNA-binding protein
MRDPGFTLSVQYLRLIAGHVRDRGVSVATWLQRSGLRERDLGDRAPGISLAMFRQLVLDALELTREPALGLIVGDRLLANTHGVLGYAVMNSATLRQAIELIERFVPLRIALVAFEHQVHRGDLQLRVRETMPLGEIARPVLEATLLTIKNVYDALMLGASITCVCFSFDVPPYASLARELFKTEVRWRQPWNGLALPDELVDRPLAMADPEALAEATRICQRELDKLVGDASMAGRVQRLLLESQNGFPSLSTTARLLHLTPRTLHRRLVDEGTSYKALLEDVRRTLAVENLKAARQGVAEIAYALGYSDVANFRRAFKRWHAVSPAQFRARATPRRR